MKKIIACFLLITILLTSCKPMVIKITIGGSQAASAANAAAPAGAVVPASGGNSADTSSGQDLSSSGAAADAAATPTPDAAAVDSASVGANPTPTPAAAPQETPTGVPFIDVAGGKGLCNSSSPSSDAYTVKVCLKAPDGGSVLSGPAAASATVAVTGGTQQVQRVTFYINGQYLLTLFHSPFTFNIPTTRWADGSYSIAVQAQMRDGFITGKAAETVTFKNGAAVSLTNKGKFTPATGTTPSGGAPFVVVATGDGASGEVNEGKVSDLVASLNPNLFLYLGDVYENGSLAEFYNWYGTGNAFYSRFRDITNPTIGNHEYLSSPGAAAYFDYWNNIPNYYSFNAGGWHFISLNANFNKIGVEKGSPQYTWLQQDLAANSTACTIAYYHQPLFNIGPEGPEDAMSDIWALLAQNHVPIVLNGHDHDYQRWVPLDGSGNPSTSGITEFVAGGGGHGVQKISRTDDRVAFSDGRTPEALGALKLVLSDRSASFSYVNITGTIIDSGTIPCNK